MKAPRTPQPSPESAPVSPKKTAGTRANGQRNSPAKAPTAPPEVFPVSKRRPPEEIPASALRATQGKGQSKNALSLKVDVQQPEAKAKPKTKRGSSGLPLLSEGRGEGTSQQKKQPTKVPRTKPSPAPQGEDPEPRVRRSKQRSQTSATVGTLVGGSNTQEKPPTKAKRAVAKKEIPQSKAVPTKEVKKSSGSLSVRAEKGQSGGSGTPKQAKQPTKQASVRLSVPQKEEVSKSEAGSVSKPKQRPLSLPKKPKRPSNLRITVYVARGGPARGQADYEQAFPERRQALDFLSNQHGLTHDEQRQLAKTSRLKLNRRWHGSEACALRELALAPEVAAQVLRGESTTLS